MKAFTLVTLFIATDVAAPVQPDGGSTDGGDLSLFHGGPGFGLGHGPPGFGGPGWGGFDGGNHDGDHDGDHDDDDDDNNYNPCPNTLYSSAQCCSTPVLGLADLGCQSRECPSLHFDCLWLTNSGRL